MKPIKKLGVQKIKALGLNNFQNTLNNYSNSQNLGNIQSLEDCILDSYWTNSSGQRITRAKFGDTVKFNIIVSDDIPENSSFLVEPYEENIIKDKSLNYILDLTIKSSGKVKMGSTENFFLNYDWDYLLDEVGEDNKLELYCRVSNWGETVKLPLNKKGRLSVELKDIPQLILVNGHWNRALETFNIAPGGGREYYWNYFLEKRLSNFKNLAYNYFDIRQNRNTFYFDGSSLGGATSSGGARKELGKEKAKKKFSNFLNVMKGKKYYFISHSEGGAFASGIAEYLVENGISVGEHITISCDEADEFEAHPNVPTYQLNPVYFTQDSKILKEISNLARFASHSQQLVKYGKYYAVIDWMVGDYHLKNSKKYGIMIIDEKKISWQTIHTYLIDLNLFKWIDDLKEAILFVGTNTSQGAVKNKTKFYKINDTFVTSNIPK